MRTKTLLAAAVLAAGIATSMAQSNVYSLNVVGYVNQVYPANAFSMIANPLNATNNTVPQIIKGAPVGTIVYKFSAGWVGNSWDGSVWFNPAATLNPGEGAFMFVPTGPPYTNTYVGEVLQGSLTNSLPAGFSLIGSKVPQAGGVQTVLGYPAAVGNIVYKWAPGFSGSSFDGAVWSPGEPVINVAEGFFSSRGASADWVRNFTVQ
jgi:hypothetical protein